MYVIFPASELINESYYALISQECNSYPNTNTNNNNYQVHISSKSLSQERKSSDKLLNMQCNATMYEQSNYQNLSKGQLKNLIHPSCNEPLKIHQQSTFKLVKTVSDFAHELSKIHEQHSEDLHHIVEEFRQRTAELRQERPSCNNGLDNIWETFLSEVEQDSKVHFDISGVMSRGVSRPLLEKTFHMKIRSKKVFIQRENFENILRQTEDVLMKSHENTVHLLKSSEGKSNSNLNESHNDYVQQLHATNGMLNEYYSNTLPQLLEELNDVYIDVSSVVSDAIFQACNISVLKSKESCRRYGNLEHLCKEVNASIDYNNFLSLLNIPETVSTDSLHMYSSPSKSHDTHIFRNEIVAERLSYRHRYDALRQESNDLETQYKQCNDALNNLICIQSRSLNNQLYNKANELQEELSLKKFDFWITQLRLSAVNAQKELFKNESTLNVPDRKLSGIATGGNNSGNNSGMKNKWVKAFKSIKGSGKEFTDKSKHHNSSSYSSISPNVTSSEANHIFHEYTYKKITPCDVCSQILRGHSRQGIKCKLCRINIHSDCLDKAFKCIPKSRLLRRQISTAEIETPFLDEEEKLKGRDDENTYEEKEEEFSKPSQEGNTHFFQKRDNITITTPSVDYTSVSSGKWNWRRGASGTNVPIRQTSNSNLLSIGATSISATNSAPSSPVIHRRLLSGWTPPRMSSVELPDENEKSISSASTSPCPSPKPNRFIPSNLFVALYNFKPRAGDELDLKAGYKLTVIDMTNKDWWKGKLLGSIGYFPSSYVSKLLPGEKPLQVQQTASLSTNDGSVKLLRDQIVIQIGEESRDGCVLIRTGDGKQGLCSLQILTDV